MGQWTTFCILSGNPSHLLYDSNRSLHKKIKIEQARKETSNN